MSFKKAVEDDNVGQPNNRQPDTRQRKQGNGRATESAQTAGNTLQGKLTEGRRQLKENIKTQLVAGAIADVVQDFENGDFGDLSAEMLDGLFAGLNAPLALECHVLETWQDSPKYALLPSEMPSTVESGG
jgi:hypothetical protein